MPPDKQLPLPWGRDEERDQQERDRFNVKFEIENASHPLTFEEIQQQLGLSKDRLFAAISALHKSGEIGWMSRSPLPGGSRSPKELETSLCKDYEGERPLKPQGERPLKTKFLKKGGSKHRYLWLVRGKKPLCYIGGRLGCGHSELYRMAVDQAIALDQFSGCQTKKDYQAIIRKIKQKVDF